MSYQRGVNVLPERGKCPCSKCSRGVTVRGIGPTFSGVKCPTLCHTGRLTTLALLKNTQGITISIALFTENVSETLL